MENHPRTEDPYHSPRYAHNSTKGPGESPRKLEQYNINEVLNERARVLIWYYLFLNVVSVVSNGVSESKPVSKKNSGKIHLLRKN